MQATVECQISCDFSCDCSWSEAHSDSKQGATQTTLQTLNWELQAACPLSPISMSQRKETIASLYLQMTQWTAIHWTIQKTIHGLKTQTGKLAAEYYMKSIDCLNGYRCSCGNCRPMPSSRECICSHKIQVVEQKLQESDLKF